MRRLENRLEPRRRRFLHRCGIGTCRYFLEVAADRFYENTISIFNLAAGGLTVKKERFYEGLICSLNPEESGR